MKVHRVKIKLISLLIFGSFSLPLISQVQRRIIVEEIPQHKIRHFIRTRSIDKMPDFSSIHASWGKNADQSEFNLIEKVFYLDYPVSETWDFYRHSNSLNMWNGKSVRFGLLLSKCTNSAINIRNSSFHEIDTGDIYFLNLKVLKGLFNIEVAFEIIKIDKWQRILEFSYIDNNKSLGKQSIQFFDDGAGRTKIIHRSYFKSNSFIRDKIFYPHFHKKFIREFHRNMARLIESRRLPFIIMS